ncbi:hypothetical protein GL270_21225 [Aeromonas veronii]|uniref:hypothetical protein n=1 Tax=Aeromonas veronii TaxID=654 RepID=UPI001C5A71CA|nr:hypothetical protein [Aeromonas veronii]MBW3783724.1 hypothetical protein [Aeromonas veronii]
MSTTLEHWKRLVNNLHLAHRPSLHRATSWSEDADRTLTRCLAEGYSYAQIDQLLLIPLGTSAKRARELGLAKGRKNVPTRYFTPEEAALLEGPLSTALVAQTLGLTTKRVQFLRETGLWKMMPSGKRSEESEPSIKSN